MVKQSKHKQTHEAQVLTAAKAAMLRLLAQDEAQITIHGRSVTFRDPEKLQNLIDKYQTVVEAQKGRSPITSIPVRLR